MNAPRPLQTDFRSIRSPDVPQQLETAIVSRRTAIEAGFKMYWNGKPCRYGHVSVRYTYTGKCKRCVQMFRNEELTFQEIDTDYLKRKGKSN